MTAFRAATLFIAILSLAACGHHEESRVVYRDGQSPVSYVDSGDPEMEAAIQKARDTLDQFIAELNKPGKRDFGIKAGIPTDDGTEHIWVSEIAYSNGVFRGLLANEPLNIPGKHEGDPVEVKREDVSDWFIVDGDETTGGFTTEVLMKRQAVPQN
jgi:uncharacterized protein YegJ (DUF2314 family)